ncbi:MAG TPA: hypothetical protein VHT34_10215 [Clostridia bacterium]|nr:hypothetical protein [Clostridia bacterium]
MSKLSKYHKKYCKLLIEHCSEGLSFSSFASRINVCRDCLYDWEKKYPEFKTAKSIAKAKMLEYWERMGRDACIRKFNFGVWKFIMMNNFDYAEKIDQLSDGDREDFVVILPELKKVQEEANDSDGGERAAQ